MSKAFTRESDDAGEAEIPVLRPQLPPGARNLITKQGALRREEQLKALLESKKAGTKSEAEQKSIELAVRKLQATMHSLVVADAPADQEKVAFGATVVVRDDNGTEETYQIVGVDEAEPERGLISWISPLARALLSRRAGDKVRFRTPAREEELTIVSVRY
jgi:transcription elongation factor GreB